MAASTLPTAAFLHRTRHFVTFLPYSVAVAFAAMMISVAGVARPRDAVLAASVGAAWVAASAYGFTVRGRMRWVRIVVLWAVIGALAWHATQVLSGEPVNSWASSAVSLAAICALLLGFRTVFRAPGGPLNVEILAAADIAFIALSWTIVTWRIRLPGADVMTLDHGWWLTLGLVFVRYFLTLVCLMVFVDRPSWTVAILAAGLACWHCTDAMRAHSDLRGSGDLPAAAVISLIAGWLFMGYGLLRLAQSHTPGTISELKDRRRSVLGGIIVFAGLAVLFGHLLSNPRLDPTLIVMTVGLGLFYAAREFMRGRSNAVLAGSFATMAVLDHLSGVKNRRALTQDLQCSSHAKKPCGLILIDIDAFKAVNETYGHAVGDDVIRDVADSLNNLAKQTGFTTYRLAGNEFALLGAVDELLTTHVAEEARVAAARATHLTCGQLGLTVSAGVAWTESTADVEAWQLITYAAESLRIAKRDRDRLQVFTPEIANELARRSTLEHRLRHALAADDVSFEFQPIVALESGSVVGLETLARWHDEELGFVSPVEFIPVAERTGLIHQLGMAAARAAVTTAATCSERYGNIFVTFNVSPLQLRSGLFADSLISLAHEHGVRPNLLKIEVTENIFMDADDPAFQSVRELSEAGFHIALDDFGHGYSSLGYMSRVSFDVIKLDRSITTKLGDPTIRSIVQALVMTSRHRKTIIVPEGVEDAETADDLRDLGLTVGQGWLWSKSVPSAALPDLFERLGSVTNVPHQ